MAITVAMRTQVSQLYVSLFGRAPDGEGLGFWVGALESGKTFAQVAQDMYNTAPARAYYPSFATNEEIIATFYKNVLGRTADAEGLAFWTKELDAAKTEGDVFAKLINNVVNYTGNDPAGLVSQALLKNKVEVAQYYGEQNGAAAGATSVLAGVTADPATVAAAKANAGNTAAVGQTFMLTVDTLVVTGTSGNDTFLAPLVPRTDVDFPSTMNPFDITDGGAGFDTLVIEGEEGSCDASDQIGGTFNSIEKVVLNGSSSDYDINADQFAGLQQIWFEDDTSTGSTVTKLTNAITVGVTGQSYVAVDLGYKASADASNVTMGDLVGGADLQIDGEGLRTINLTGNTLFTNGLPADLNDDGVGDAGVVLSQDDDNVTTLNITSSKSIAVVAASIETITKIDASTSTGDVYAVINLKDVSTTDVTSGVTYIGSQGNDTVSIELNELDPKDVLNGGSGFDNLLINYDTLTSNELTAAQYAIVNKLGFEQISFNESGGDFDLKIDASKLTASYIGTEEDATISKLENTDTVVFNNTVSDRTLDLLAKRDVIDPTKYASGSGTVNLTSQTEGVVVDISVNDKESSDFSKLVLTGAGDVHFDNTNGYGVDINAANLTGRLEVHLAYDAIDKVTLGSGNDVIVLVNTDADPDDSLSEFGTMDTITGFTSGKDKFLVAGDVTYTEYKGELGLDFSSTVSMALMAAADAGKDVTSFVWNGNTYLVQDNEDGDSGLFDPALDMVVKLTGIVSLTSYDFNSIDHLD